jgi:hypothetical protein
LAFELEMAADEMEELGWCHQGVHEPTFGWSMQPGTG